MESSSLYPLRDGSSDWAASQATATSVRAVLASFVLHLFVVFLSFWVTSRTAFNLVLGFFSVLTVWPSATQLLINTTWLSLPRDIGTPSRSTGTLEPRDIGTPSAQGGERAPTREPAKGTDPKNGIFQVSPRASSAVSPLPGSWPSRSWRLRRSG